EHTPYSGTSAASANAAAVTSPTRSPVNGPGPSPATTAPTAVGAAPASASTSRIAGPSSSPCRRGSTFTRTAGGRPEPSVTAAAVTAGVAVSTASTSTVRAYESGTARPAAALRCIRPRRV